MTGHGPLEQRIAARIDALRGAQLLRTLRPPRGVDLSSNDYLSLSRHPRLKDEMIAEIRRDGCGSTGSRLLRGERECFARLEENFAAFKQAGRSLYFSSGYLANLAVMTTFPESGDVIFSDERNHASLIDGIRLSAARRMIFPHNDLDALARQLQQPRAGQAFVVVESLFSMDGDEAPLTDLAILCRTAGAALVVDEAHAFGIRGERGSGLVEATGIGSDVFVTVNTAGKALGVAGAFVAGPLWAIDYLIQRARPFIFSTAPPPAVAAALEASLAVLASEPERRHRLMHLARYLRGRLQRAGVTVMPGDSHIIPVIIGDNHQALAVANAMETDGFDVRAIRPPSVPEGTARLRITVNVGLDEATLDRFVAALAAALRHETALRRAAYPAEPALDLS
jgi:8-amino-7-oxononanoate synthase